MPKTENTKRKTVPYPTPAHAEADRLLAEVAAARTSRMRSEGELQAELERLQQLSPFWQGLKEAYLQDLQQETEAAARLEAFEAKNKWALFTPRGVAPESLKVELPGGELFYSLEEYVVKPRKVDVLANLERYGFEEAIRRTKAVDWDALADPEEWPNEVLAIIGTRREKRETFTFEVKGDR